MPKFEDESLVFEHTDTRGLVRTTRNDVLAREHYLSKFIYKAVAHPKHSNETIHREFVYTDNRKDFLALLEKWNRVGSLDSVIQWTYTEE